MFDLGPATQEMSRLISCVHDDQLDRPTPCTDWTVAQLLTHVHEFATVFSHTARGEQAQPPGELVDDWREAIPAELAELATAWRDEAAWHGVVSAGGVEMSAADNAVVAIEELTTHGWDLARATGQQLVVEDASLDQVDRFFTLFDDQTPSGEGPFGPEAQPPEQPSRLELTIARTGRDPSWRPPG